MEQNNEPAKDDEFQQIDQPNTLIQSKSSSKNLLSKNEVEMTKTASCKEDQFVDISNQPDQVRQDYMDEEAYISQNTNSINISMTSVLTQGSIIVTCILASLIYSSILLNSSSKTYNALQLSTGSALVAEIVSIAALARYKPLDFLWFIALPKELRWNQFYVSFSFSIGATLFVQEKSFWIKAILVFIVIPQFTFFTQDNQMVKIFSLFLILFGSLMLVQSDDSLLKMLCLLGVFMIGSGIMGQKRIGEIAYRRKQHIAWLSIFYTSLSFLLIGPLYMMPQMAKQAKLPGSEQLKPTVWSIWLYFVVNGCLIAVAGKKAVDLMLVQSNLTSSIQMQILMTWIPLVFSGVVAIKVFNEQFGLTLGICVAVTMVLICFSDAFLLRKN